jgi:hypothetical protein
VLVNNLPGKRTQFSAASSGRSDLTRRIRGQARVMSNAHQARRPS